MKSIILDYDYITRLGKILCALENIKPMNYSLLRIQLRFFGLLSVNNIQLKILNDRKDIIYHIDDDNYKNNQFSSVTEVGLKKIKILNKIDMIMCGVWDCDISDCISIDCDVKVLETYPAMFEFSKNSIITFQVGLMCHFEKISLSNKKTDKDIIYHHNKYFCSSSFLKKFINKILILGYIDFDNNLTDKGKKAIQKLKLLRTELFNINIRGKI